MLLLSCILVLRYTNDTNFIFFYQNFQFFYFHLDEQWGLMPCTHQSVWRAKNALQLNSLLLFEIWQVFLLEKPVMCIDESVKILRPSGNGGVNFVIVHFRFQGYKFYTNFRSSFFTSTSNGVSYLALINWFAGLKMRCS